MPRGIAVHFVYQTDTEGRNSTLIGGAHVIRLLLAGRYVEAMLLHFIFHITPSCFFQVTQYLAKNSNQVNITGIGIIGIMLYEAFA
jgi:hypothetical protein